MATMNFSIPDDVKERFNQAFADANKSAVVAKLMEEAIDKIERKRRSDKAIRGILNRRSKGMSVSTEEIVKTRNEIRAKSDAAHGLRRK